jgi:hypothetical protein
VDSEETDFVEDALSDVSTSRFFARYAKNIAWLKWVERKNLVMPGLPAEEGIAVEAGPRIIPCNLWSR